MGPAGFDDIRRFDTLESTNTYLLAEARAGAPAGIVAVADHQTAGRGRLGRRWEAPPGTCLLTSVLLRPVLAPGTLHLCTAAVALAAVDACSAVAGVTPAIKWPNDLLLDGRKVAGVLAESDGGAPGGAPGSVAVVVGIGINVDWAGPPWAGGAALAGVAGRAVDRRVLLDALLAALGPRVEALESPGGRAAVAEELRARCETLGRAVRVEMALGSVEGTAVGLTGSGHLLVRTNGGSQEITAGDVVHLRARGGRNTEQ